MSKPPSVWTIMTFYSRCLNYFKWHIFLSLRTGSGVEGVNLHTRELVRLTMFSILVLVSQYYPTRMTKVVTGWRHTGIHLMNWRDKEVNILLTLLSTSEWLDNTPNLLLYMYFRVPDRESIRELFTIFFFLSTKITINFTQKSRVENGEVEV